MILLLVSLFWLPANFQSAPVSRAPELIDSYLASGREREADELLEKMLREPTATLETDRALAAACVRRGHAALAARYLERARHRHAAPILLADLAAAYFMAGDFAKTAATLDGMARNSQLAPALSSLRGMAALRLDKRREALAHFRTALAGDSNEGTANFYLGTLAAEAGDLPRALRHLEIAARNYRDRYAARYNLALSLYRAGRWQEGVKLLAQLGAEESGSTAEVHNLLGHGYDKLDRVKEAVDSYQKAILQEPKNPSYVFDLGLMALRRRTYDLAEIVFSAGLQRFPENRNLALALGGTFQLRGQMERARQTFQAMLANHPRDPLVHLYLGNSYFEEGRFEDAIKAFTQGLEIEPGDSLFHYQTAVSLMKLGQDSDGRVRQLLERAIELDPKLAAAYYQLAKLAADSNNTARARELLQRSLRLDPKMSEAHFLLARLCRQGGDAPCATTALKRYEELRSRERERLENDRVLGILFTLEKR